MAAVSVERSIGLDPMRPGWIYKVALCVSLDNKLVQLST